MSKTPTATPARPHALPAWFEWVQDRLFLSALILAEAYLLGDLMQRGWVGNIEAPATWGTYHGVGVVLFFAAGAMAAGVALGCSVRASNAFADGKWRSGLFNFLGLLAFAACEIWASLSERSAHLTPTPADSVVLSWAGVPALPVSPTVLIVALLLPFTTLYYGFSRQTVVASVEEERARLERELELEPLRQALAARRAVGNIGVMREAVAAVRGGSRPPQPLPTGPGTPTAAPAPAADVAVAAATTTDRKVVALSQPTPAPARRAARMRAGSKRATAARTLTATVEPKVRHAWRPGMTVGQLERAAGISRGAAGKWHRVLSREEARATQAGQIAQ